MVTALLLEIRTRVDRKNLPCLTWRMKIHSTLLAIVLFFAGSVLFVAACGDDDDSSGSAPAASDSSGGEANGNNATDESDEENGDGDSTDAEELVDSLDFGDGAAMVTIGDIQYEFALGGNITADGTTRTGVCQSLFGLLAGQGYDPEGSELGIEFEIPPPDWESYDDGRFDTSTPKILIEGVRHESLPADDPNPGGWRADIEWQETRLPVQPPFSRSTTSGSLLKARNLSKAASRSGVPKTS
jgi:hypothetical protein